MRIVTRIVTMKELEGRGVDMSAIFERLLQANYHSALDPRYAVEDGELVAAFLHPLSTLSEDQFYSALQQVTEMAWTFGTSYSSSEIIYGSRQS